jgi:hypothetical protein
MSEIEAAALEQSEGIAQVNKAITQIDEVTQHNAALVEEAAAAAKSLEEQATVLRDAVAVFRLNEGELSIARKGVASVVPNAPANSSELRSQGGLSLSTS